MNDRERVRLAVIALDAAESAYDVAVRDAEYRGADPETDSGVAGKRWVVCSARLDLVHARNADDPDDDATRDAARWAQQDAGEVPDWDAEERAVARQDAEDRDNWNRRAR